MAPSLNFNLTSILGKKMCLFGQPQCFQSVDKNNGQKGTNPVARGQSLAPPSMTNSISDASVPSGGTTHHNDDTVFDVFKKMLGFGPPCQNGGTKLVSGECLCEQHFLGKQCENNSTRTPMNACQCDNVHITGRFCERIACENSGQPVYGEGYCKCLEDWYTGRFCESYSAPWMYILIGVIVGLLLLIIFCVVCRLRMYAREMRPARTPHTAVRPPAPNLPPSSTRNQNAQQQIRRLRQHDERARQYDGFRAAARPAMLQLHTNERGEQEMRLVPPPVPVGSVAVQGTHVHIPPAYSTDTRNDADIARAIHEQQQLLVKPGTPPPSYEQVGRLLHLDLNRLLQVIRESHRYPRAPSEDRSESNQPNPPNLDRQRALPRR